MQHPALCTRWAITLWFCCWTGAGVSRVRPPCLHRLHLPSCRVLLPRMVTLCVSWATLSPWPRQGARVANAPGAPLRLLGPSTPRAELSPRTSRPPAPPQWRSSMHGGSASAGGAKMPRLRRISLSWTIRLSPLLRRKCSHCSGKARGQTWLGYSTSHPLQPLPGTSCCTAPLLAYWTALPRHYWQPILSTTKACGRIAFLACG